MTDINICSFVSNAPYFIACDAGYMTLVPSKVKCEIKCNAWINGKCIRLSKGNECNCGGDVDANKSN